MDVVIGLVVFAVLLALYFLPTIVAVARHKRNVVAIGALNFLLGWTLIAWIAALIWALMDDASAPVASPSSPDLSSNEQPEQRRAGFSWKWIGIGAAGAFGIIVLVAVIAQPSSESTAPSSEGTTSRTSTSTSGSTPTPTPPPRVEAGFLLEEREANASRFDATYRGKWVTVYGRIDDIDNGKVYLEEQDILSRVALHDLSDEDIMPLNVGQEYWAVCKVGNYVFFAMELKSCRTAAKPPAPTATLVPPTPTPAPPLTPEHMFTPTPTITSTPSPTPIVSTPVDLVERVEEGVVRVNTFIGRGTGFIFDIEGATAFVATNYHVIERGLDTVEVIVGDIHTYEALVLGWDPDRDVAVLSICCSDDFTALTWEEALPIEGTDVVAVGYPRGGSDYQVTATTGEVVSRDEHSSRLNLISHTAPLNPGSSGGPLFSIPDAKVLGINTSRGTTTLSFYAVPLQAIEEQMNEWRSQLVTR